MCSGRLRRTTSLETSCRCSHPRMRTPFAGPGLPRPAQSLHEVLPDRPNNCFPVSRTTCQDKPPLSGWRILADRALNKNERDAPQKPQRFIAGQSSRRFGTSWLVNEKQPTTFRENDPRSNQKQPMDSPETFGGQQEPSSSLQRAGNIPKQHTSNANEG